jgi:PAS domain S-box-containing protein
VSVISKNINSTGSDRRFAEKVRRLYSNQQLAYIGNLVNASILVAIQWNRIDHPVLWAWLGLIVLITLARGFLAREYNRRNGRPARVGAWDKLLIAVVFASGTAWGLAGIYMFPSSSDAHQMFTAFTIGGMVAGASAVFSAIHSVFLAFSLPAMLPVIIHSLLFRDGIHYGMAAMLTLFLMLMTATSLRNRKVIDASIKLRFEKQGLLDYLAEAKERAESMNRRLKGEIDERRRIEGELERHQRELESTVEQRTRELQARNGELQFEIKERARVEAALRDSQERYRLLIENTIAGIVVIRDQKIIFANAFVAALSGYAVDEIIGMSFIDFIHPDDRELAISNHSRRLNGEHLADSYSIRLLNKEKQVCWLEVSAVRLSYEGAPAVLVFMRDVSRQRMLEAQLYQSEKMASVGQLAAGVAHEINNPVGFVSSNLHTLDGYHKDIEVLISRYREVLAETAALLNDGADHPVADKISAVGRLEADMDLNFILQDGPQLIGESRDGMDRIKKIVLDLKNFAHPGEQDRQLININQCIASTLNIAWNELKYSATVIKDFGQIPEIEGYPQQLNQVFMNLLVNAAQSLNEKGEIRIRTRQENGNVEIKISDTGCGVPRENLEKIFEPFFTTKAVGKGTGLGLNVSYNIIKKHNGTIQAASNVGEGTTFTILLPVYPLDFPVTGGDQKNDGLDTQDKDYATGPAGLAPEKAGQNRTDASAEII